MPEYAPYELDNEGPGTLRYRTVSGDRKPTAKATVAKQVLAYPSVTPPVPVPTALDSTYISDITEAAQDAVGAMAANSTKVTLTYVDGTPSLTADIIAGSLGPADIANRTRTFDVVSFVLAVGTPALLVRGGNLRYGAWDLDSGTTEVVTTSYGGFVVPADWTSGALTFFWHWTNLGAGTGDVVWTMNAKEVNDTGDLNSTTSEATSQQTVTAPAQNIRKVSTSTMSLTPSAALTHVRFSIGRIGGDAADTLGNDAGFLKLQVAYVADS